MSRQVEAPTDTASEGVEMRVLARIGGSLLIFLGVLAVAVAVVVMVVVGTDDTVELKPQEIKTAGPSIATARNLLSVYNTTLVIDADPVRSQQKLWIGVAHQDDLDSYLGDTSRAEILSYNFPDKLGIHNFDGTDSTLTAPAGLDWWVASEHGKGEVELAWPMQNGSYGAVIMNQDGSRKVDANVRLGLQIKGVFRSALFAGIGGLLAIALGVGIFIWTRKRRTDLPPSGGQR